MTAPRMATQTRAEIVRLLNDGIPAYRVAKETRVWVDSVRAIRDEEGIPKVRAGNPRSPRPAPVGFDDPDETDDAPALADPHRIPVGAWCAERPNQARWMELVDAATRATAVALRTAVTRVLGLPPAATDLQIETALIAERRTADELAGLYLAAVEGK